MTTTNAGRDVLLQQALAPGEGCPELAQLIEASFSGFAGPQGAALRAHAATCAHCTAELTLAAVFDAAPKSAAEAAEIERLAGELRSPVRVEVAAPPPLARVLPMAAHREKRARSTASGGGGALWQKWAAAALVVVGLGFFFEWGHRSFAPSLPSGPGAWNSEVVRSGEMRILSPTGILEGAGAEALPEISWQPAEGANRYRVELVDVGGETLWQGEAVEPRLAPSAALRSVVETFVTYRLRVTALDDAGGALGSPASASFRIEPAAQ